MIPDFEEVARARYNASSRDGDKEGERDGEPWHLFDIGELPGSTSERKIREDALAPEGPSSPLEMAGNLYVYLIPSIFKEHGADREEPPRGPSLPAGSCFEERTTAVRGFSYNTSHIVEWIRSIFMQNNIWPQM